MSKKQETFEEYKVRFIGESYGQLGYAKSVDTASLRKQYDKLYPAVVEKVEVKAPVKEETKVSTREEKK